MTSHEPDEARDLMRLAHEALRRGDLLQAYDLASSGNESPRGLAYLKILALARMGEAEEALRLYEETDLETGTLDERALKGRILKDLALEGHASDTSHALQQALRIYLNLFQETGEYFPGINAATLALIQGDATLSREIASFVLSTREVMRCNDYFAAVTKAEASILLGDLTEAKSALALAAKTAGADPGSRSTTLRQLLRIAAALRLDEDVTGELFASLRPDNVAFYCGHIFLSDRVLEQKLSRQIHERLAGSNIGFGYGALAAGADILLAEALLERGAELHVLLPFVETDFIQASVDVAGRDWVERYLRCKAAAASFSEATSMGYVGDPRQFSHGSTIAMGLAKLRARFLGSEAVQLAVWDGEEAGIAGTGADVAKWKNGGGRTAVVPAKEFKRPWCDEVSPVFGEVRENRAIIFADLPGFTKIPEALLPLFWEHVMGKASTVLAQFGSHLENSNTWGDALYLVFRSTTAAAAAMIQLQDELAELKYEELGFAQPPTFRVAGHYAPVYLGTDPVTGRNSVYGVEVSKAARIEPVTPPGAIYITASFAAQLEMESPAKFQAIYVGRVPLAKSYGETPIYRLKKQR